MQLIGMILTKVPFWNELDYIGIDAYFPLSDAVTPTVAELKKWKAHILKMDKLQTKINKKYFSLKIWLPQL
jgi:hypothetical protein